MVFLKKRAIKKAFAVLLFIFSCIGFLFTIVFLGMQMNIFKVPGSITQRNEKIGITTEDALPENKLTQKKITECKVSVLSVEAPDTAGAILQIITEGNYQLANTMIEKAANSINNETLVQEISQCNTSYTNYALPILNKTAYGWANTQEWQTLKAALTRDADIINKASKDSGVPARYIVGSVIGEQFRFFAGMRTAFKNYFEPLKIFGRLSKFSYGIAGLKPDTVRLIEKHLTDRNSIFYIGPKYEQFSSYSNYELQNYDDPQLHRITNPDDNYYSYLYVGLYINQVIKQWQNAGYDISDKPGVLATLYNLGFNRSIPKGNPLPGGAEITVNNQVYTFGQIAEEFYWSGELIQEFPY